MNTGMIVVGVRMGEFLIEDIGVLVPYNVAVPITPEQAVRSKDLYRALNQKIIFKLDGIVGVSSVVPEEIPPIPETKSSPPAQEGIALRQELSEVKSRLSQILTLLAQTPTGPTPQAVGSKPIQEVVEELDFIDIETPAFIPDKIKPTGAEAQIDIGHKVSEGAGVGEATSKLRKLRKK